MTAAASLTASGSAPLLAAAIQSAELEMLKHDQAPCPVYHHFSPGLYIRELNMAAGTLAIGHCQKTEHLNIFLKGKVSVYNDDGTTSLLEAPMIFTGKPGRKCGLVQEDVVWLNVYPTDETDIEKLEAMFLDKSDGWKDNQQKHDDNTEDRDDFKSVLEEYGFTEETVRLQSENIEDQVCFPAGSYRVGVFDSPIEGKGLFATADIKAGEIIAPARIGGRRTPAGRYTNHAKNCNAVMENMGEFVQLKAIKDIAGCQGGSLGDEITIDYRNALELKGLKPCQE